MTVVAVIVTPAGEVVMGADRQTTDDAGLKWSNPGKILRLPSELGDVLIANAGSAALCALARYKVPLGTPAGDLDRWAQEYADAWTEAARGAKITETADGPVDGEAVLAVAGRAWAIEEGLAFAVDGYAAIGSGAPVAMGALEVLDRSDAKRAVTAAVDAACRWADGCNGPAVIERLKAER